MASQKEASICVWSPPITARNTPRSRCSSAHHQRSSDLSTASSASVIASRASETRFAKNKASPLSARKYGLRSIGPVRDSPVFRLRSTRYLPPCCRKRSGPSRGKSSLQAAKMQNSDASTAQSNPMPSVPFPQDYLRGDRESPPKKVVKRLTRAYHSALSPARWLLPWSRGNGRFHRNANRIGPQIRDNGRRAR